jgi:hypothetical protein
MARLTGGKIPHMLRGMAELLTEIDAFLADHGLSDWQFGEKALNDKHFIRQLREGRDVRMSTLHRVRAFMAEYREAA